MSPGHRLLPALALLVAACGGLPFVGVDDFTFGGQGAAPGLAEGGDADAGSSVEAGRAADAEASVPGDAAEGAMDAGRDAADAEGSACDPVYSRTNGEGETFLSCDPPGTYSAASAMEACVAYAVARDAGAGACSGNASCESADIMAVFDLAKCGATPGWGYAGAITGEITECGACETKTGTW